MEGRRRRKTQGRGRGPLTARRRRRADRTLHRLVGPEAGTMAPSPTRHTRHPDRGRQRTERPATDRGHVPTPTGLCHDRSELANHPVPPHSTSRRLLLLRTGRQNSCAANTVRHRTTSPDRRQPKTRRCCAPVSALRGRTHDRRRDHQTRPRRQHRSTQPRVLRTRLAPASAYR